MKTQEVVDALKKLGWKISFAESCTGGLCASEVVSISGASNVIGESYVTYSNESKEKILKVKPETIKKFDVVSKEVAQEMAIGLARITDANCCVSVTGYAGSTPNSKIEHGTVYVGVYMDGIESVYKFEYPSLPRNEVRTKIVENVFDILYNEIQLRYDTILK